MKVKNCTTHPIIAFGYHIKRGYGEDVRIEPGEEKDVPGPYLGEMDGGACYVHIDGEIECHSSQDGDAGFQVIKGKPLCLKLKSGDVGVTVRHYKDEPEPFVKRWRAESVCAPPASYCLDVTVGRDERYRQELIDFLMQSGKPFKIGKVQRGMWQGRKILRIETSDAETLQQHIYNSLHSGDDYDYIIHASFIDAQRSDTWLPDLDTRYNAEPFSLTETATA